MNRPLYYKFRSFEGLPYIYDSETSEILKVSESVFVAIDEYFSSSKSYASSDIQLKDESSAVSSLKAFQKLGFLSLDPPQQSVIFSSLKINGANLSADVFFNNYRRHLILEITQQCNLRCDYCIYSGIYPLSRNHTEKVMDFETAKKAVSNHLSKCTRNDDCGGSIGFYGGEPLLEFGLIKTIFTYAKDYAKNITTPVNFTITTNGTLLTDEVSDFLVENNFHILLSLDGTKDDHDRHRKFKNSDLGSFDVICNNLDNFLSRHPGFTQIALTVTISDKTNVQQCDTFLKRYSDRIGIRASNIKPLEVFLHFDKTSSQDYSLPQNFSQRDCCDSCGCDTFSCQSDHIAAIGIAGKTSLLGGVWDQVFDQYNLEFLNRFMLDPTSASLEYPLSTALLKGRLQYIHFRKIYRPQVACLSVVRCFPGVTRMLCNASGELFPCEKVWNTDQFKIGSLKKGIDVKKASYLCQSTSLCGHCEAKHICQICPAQLYEKDGEIDLVGLKNTCACMRFQALKDLQLYTSILEKNSTAFHGFIEDLHSAPSWFNSIQFNTFPVERMSAAAKTEDETPKLKEK